MSQINIEKKIVKYRVEKPEDAAAAAASKAAPAPVLRQEDNVVWMHEKLERPDMLIGSTYKIKTPVSSRSSSTPRTSITSNGSWR